MSSSQSSALEKRFELTKRGSTVRKEIVAGLTTFLAMVYSVIVGIGLYCNLLSCRLRLTFNRFLG